MVDTIKVWSHTKLTDFESCPLKAKKKYIEKIAEAKSEAADRGTKIHTLAEDFVSGKLRAMPEELKHFAEEFEALRILYKDGKVSIEGEWGFDKNWQPADYFKSAWLRVKLDARLAKTKTHSVVVDYKTGKKKGNEVKHAEQITLYGIAEILREPDVLTVDVELWYLDTDEITQMSFTRDQLIARIPSFEKRGLAVTEATDFPPNANLYSCMWCPYGPNKDNSCEHGVSGNKQNNIAFYRRKYS
jgi:hypothetical protein